MAVNDPIGRYKSAQEGVARAKATMAEALKQPLVVGRENKGMGSLFGPLIQHTRAKKELESAKFDYDMFNIKLGGVNRQLAQGINARNQEAAMMDVEAQGEAARTTQTAEVDDGPVAQGQADTATAGGTSGRRRRNIIETGSIRI